MIDSGLFLEFYKGLREDINGEINSYFAGLAFGHSPSFEEKLVHFMANGGLAEYRRRFFAKHPQFAASVSQAANSQAISTARSLLLCKRSA
ncbi:hypothetical protein KGQ27_03200 [Patescibacteria group bacterium]|nr:hypothetical protein [Patescibacteria group bacterium]MDE1946729.1 hypothetical protein [Patescibacteria group bacterium]MDE2010968.1 hypothetical protein [Patescibacteria group bacterium]MDE2232811.1 hypothetical protein [Patescibacteria group bacterium]